MDELEVNMEEDDDESSKSEVKLGKLQFSLDYDFQKGEVRVQTCPQLRCHITVHHNHYKFNAEN